MVVVVGGGRGSNSGNTLIKSKRKNINCNVLLSIQPMDKRPRMNVLQTPGFQYCVYFDGLSPALCNFRGLCVWLVFV